MKTVEEFIREIESSDALKNELNAADGKDMIADFLKKHDVNATAEEFGKAYMSFAEGEIADDEAESAAGGIYNYQGSGSYGTSSYYPSRREMGSPCSCGYFGDYVLIGTVYRCPDCLRGYTSVVEIVPVV